MPQNGDSFFDFLVMSAKYEEGLRAADMPQPMPYQPLSGQKRKVLDDLASLCPPHGTLINGPGQRIHGTVAAKNIKSGDIETVVRIARSEENPLKTNPSVLDIECIYSTFDKPLECSLPPLLDIHREQGMGWRCQVKGLFYAHCKYFQKIWAAVNRKRRLQGMRRHNTTA